MVFPVIRDILKSSSCLPQESVLPVYTTPWDSDPHPSIFLWSSRHTFLSVVAIGWGYTSKIITMTNPQRIKILWDNVLHIGKKNISLETLKNIPKLTNLVTQLFMLVTYRENIFPKPFFTATLHFHSLLCLSPFIITILLSSSPRHISKAM